MWAVRVFMTFNSDKYDVEKY